MKSIKNYILFAIGLLSLTQTSIYCAAAAPKEFIHYESCLSDDSIRELIVVAQILHDTYPTKDYIIYGIGNSPAFLIQALKMIYPEEKERFRHIIFSGSWWYTIKGEDETLHRVKDKEGKKFNPNEQDIDLYHKYLSEAVPLTDITTLNKKIIFIDLVDSGAGIRSFAELTNNWIEQALKYESQDKEKVFSSIQFHLFKEVEFLTAKKATSHYLQFPQWEDISFTEETLPDSIRACGEINEGSERLLMKFPFKKWSKENPHSFKPKKEAQITVKRISEKVKEITKR